LPTQLGRHFWPDFASVLGIRVDFLSPTIYLTDVFVLVIFILWLFRSLQNLTLKALKRKDKKIIFKPYFLHFAKSPFLVFIFVFLFLILNVLISGRILGGMYSLLKFLEISFVAHYMAQFIYEKNQLRKIISLFSISVIFESLLAIIQFMKQGSIGGLLYFLGERTFDGSTPGIANASLNGELVLRPYATFPHPNVLAGYLLIVMILILFSLESIEELKIKTLKLVTLFLASIALVLSMSRVAILLWVFVVVYYFLSQSKRKIALCVLAFIALFILSPLGVRFRGITAGDEAIVMRSVLIDSSLKMIGKNPFIGIGLGNFIPILSTIQKPLSFGLYLQPVHNIFFLVAAETGLIGLGFFLWLLFKTFKRIMTYESKTKACLFIIISSILILGLFDHYWLTLQQGQLLFGCIIGLCWVVKERKFFS